MLIISLLLLNSELSSCTLRRSITWWPFWHVSKQESWLCPCFRRIQHAETLLSCFHALYKVVAPSTHSPASLTTMPKSWQVRNFCWRVHVLMYSLLNKTDLNLFPGIKDTFTRWKRPTAAWPEQLTVDCNQRWSITVRNRPINFRPCCFGSLPFFSTRRDPRSEPKGVMITHGNLAHNLTIITNELKASDDTVVVSWLPQYHDMGLIGSYLGVLLLWRNWLLHVTSILFAATHAVDGGRLANTRRRTCRHPISPLNLTARKFTPASKLDFSSVRHVINAAEPVDEESIDSFVKTFGPFGFGNVIFPTYGLAEHTVFVCSGGKQRLSVLKEPLEVDGIVQVNKRQQQYSDKARGMWISGSPGSGCEDCTHRDA